MVLHMAMAFGSVEFSAWRAVLMADPCVYCGGTPTGMDHIRPGNCVFHKTSIGWGRF
jgi:hypothetical protein